MKESILNKNVNFSEWYNDIIRISKIIDDRYPIKGMPVYYPNGYFAIKKILNILENELEKCGFEPYWFPILIPYDIFKRESEHIKGFESEVFYVTPSKPVEEEKEIKYILRPTSETEMYYMFSLWIRSYRDLPLLTYMTNTVYRYETKATKPLVRGREILWNEAHTAHRDLDDAEKTIKKSIEIYSKVFWDHLSVPHIWIKRPDWDKFAGADYTFAADTILPDGKFLQIGTTHLLGRNFSKAFNIIFEDEHPFIKIDKNKFEAFNENNYRYEIEIIEDKIKIRLYDNNNKESIRSYEENIEFDGNISEDNKNLINKMNNIIKNKFNENKLVNKKFVWQTSFGISMRTLSAVISIHGDNKGLILPFEISHIQIIIIPIYYSEDERSKILKYCEDVYNLLKEKYRVKIDKDDTKSPGWKFNQYELMGVPFRISIGKKELEKNTVTISVRQYDSKSKNYEVKLENLLNELDRLIIEYDKEIKERARKYFENKILKIDSLKDLENNLDKNVAFKVPFCMREECAKNIKEKYSLDVRGTDVIPEDAKNKKCIFCNTNVKYYVYVGKSY